MLETALPKLSFSGVPAATRMAERSGSVLAVGGPTGNGKSSSGKEVAKELGIPAQFISWADARDPNHEGGIVTFNCAGVHEETARGIQVPHHEGNGDYRSVSIKPEEAPVWETVGDKPILVILEEWQAASGQIKQAYRPALYAPDGQDRYIGVHRVGPNVRFMITFNGRLDDVENGRELSQPDAARCSQYRFELSIGDFLNHTAPTFKASPIWAYLNFFRQGVETQGEGLNPWTGKIKGEDKPSRYTGGAVCSGRTWEGVLRMFPDWDAIKDVDFFSLHAASRIPQPVVDDMVNLIKTVIEVGPEVTEIREGRKTIAGVPKHHHAAIAFAAARIALNEGGKDYPAAISSGQWDWAFDLFESCSPELGAWVFSTLAAHTQPEGDGDNPIYTHASAARLKGLVS
tara:strand:- start:1390 stop:2595 length:1206 start_codon:yes stop_codon:yes gene_type:complete